MIKFIQVILFSLIGIWTYHSHAANQVSVAVYAQHEQYLIASAPYGLSWKILKLAAQAKGLTLVPEKGSWQGAMSRLKGQKVQLIFPAFKNAEREEWAAFTLPLIPTGSSIFTHTNNPAKQLSQVDLSQAIIGVTSGSVQEKLATQLGFEQIYATDQRDQLFSMLKQKRLNYLFVASAAADYYCMFFDESHKTDCLATVGQEYASQHAHAMSSNSQKSKSLMNKINSGLIKVQHSQAVQRLFSQYNYNHIDLQNWQKSLTEK